MDFPLKLNTKSGLWLPELLLAEVNLVISIKASLIFKIPSMSMLSSTTQSVHMVLLVIRHQINLKKMAA
jgi:hypothetical protein